MVINISKWTPVTDQLSTYLADKGLKATRQRELILRILSRAGRHLSADELFSEVKRTSPRIGFATVYRTLRLLADAGLAREQRFEDGCSRFELADAGTHHDHLICTVCGRIVEFENERIEELQQKVAKRNRFIVTNHKLEIYGHCWSCEQKHKLKR